MNEQELEKIRGIMRESLEPITEKINTIEMKLYKGNGESLTTRMALMEQAHDSCQKNIIEPLREKLKTETAQRYTLITAIVLGIFNLAGIVLQAIAK